MLMLYSSTCPFRPWNRHELGILKYNIQHCTVSTSSLGKGLEPSIIMEWSSLVGVYPDSVFTFLLRTCHYVSYTDRCTVVQLPYVRWHWPCLILLFCFSAFLLWPFFPLWQTCLLLLTWSRLKEAPLSFSLFPPQHNIYPNCNSPAWVPITERQKKKKRKEKKRKRGKRKNV